jgi:glycosyltransferase involved in cell wall biosynthesis
MNHKPETLVILAPAFPANEADENWVPTHQSAVRSLKKQFPELKIVVLTFFYPKQIGRYHWNGVEIVSFDGMRLRKAKRVLLWRNIWRELQGIRRKDQVIGLLSFWCGETALIGHYFGKLHSIRHRCWISGQDAQKGNRWVRVMRPKSEELVAMSTYLQATFYENYGVRPQRVITNGIDSRMFEGGGGGSAGGTVGDSGKNAGAEMSETEAGGGSVATGKERTIDVFSAGSLVPLKQYHLLVEVLASLQSRLPEIRAVHCGDGQEKDRLELQIRELGLEANLRLLGERPHREVLQWMQKSKLFLHPSSSEGFSTVCLEALYAGAQVISFCDPGDQSVPQWHIVRNAEEMAEKALEILHRPDMEYKPVLLHAMDDVARAIMSLFR